MTYKQCPNCGKKGLGRWRSMVGMRIGMTRDCRYCYRVEEKPFASSWNVDKYPTEVRSNPSTMQH